MAKKNPKRQNTSIVAMILIDSNILIYSAQEKHRQLRNLFKEQDAVVSIITKLEVLGYYKITSEQLFYFQTIFKLVGIVQINEVLIDQAIHYRQKKSMSVGDSIIAATAKLYKCDLYTNNETDFKIIKDFKIINPL
ncbi:MAG: type II toxin-antitoxin system VapC family toxin [Ginsengibacter sp.]